MTRSIQVSTVRGAGLAFPLACLWYVFSGKLSVFWLVPVGAGVGFLVGLILSKYPGLKRSSRSSTGHVASGSVKQTAFAAFLTHPDLIVRFLSLLVFGTLLFLLAWLVGYYLLPEGIFLSATAAQMARSQLETTSTGILEEWIRILRANLIPVLLILLGSLLIRVNKISVGYVVTLFNLVGYGIFVGTNSFAIPYPERLAPTLQILSRSGPYELAALVLLAASSYRWAYFEIKRIFITNPERVASGPRFAWQDAARVAIGISILLVANWIEASMIMSL